MSMKKWDLDLLEEISGIAGVSPETIKKDVTILSRELFNVDFLDPETMSEKNDFRTIDRGR